MGKKIFTVGVVATTIFWSLGVATLVPAVANAATLVDCATIVAGDFIKGTGAAVWVVNSDKSMSYFPDGDTFKSWTADSTYKSIKTVSATCMGTFPQASIVATRPGTYLLKDDATNKLYTVLADGKLATITADVALALYGVNYAKTPALGGRTIKVTTPDMMNYNKSLSTTAVTEKVPTSGSLVSNAGKYYVVGTGMTLREVTATGLVANKFQTKLSYPLTSVAGYTVGTSVTAAEAALVDATFGFKSNGTTLPTVNTGAVSVSLSANTPAGGNVVINVDNVVFGKFLLNATNGDYVISSVTIGRKGLGTKGDFASVTLYDGATKLGTSKTSWDSNTETTVYNIPNGLKVTNGTSKELTVVGKLDTSATYNALGIVAINGVSVSPVYGNEMTGVNVAVGGVTISNMGTAATKKIGVSGVTLAEFKLTVSSTEDGVFKSILLKNKAATNNASDTDIANLYLYQGATLLAGPVSMASDKVSFNLTEDKYVTIAKSKNEVFKVVGDVVNGDNNTLELVLENTTDLVLTGKTYGTALSVHNDAYKVATNGAIITIDGAELNVAYTGTNLDSIDDVTDVVFGTLSFGAGATDVKITSLILTIDETEGNATAADTLDVDNFELVEANGGAFSGTMTNGGDADADDETWTFSDEIYLSAGQTRIFTLRGDLPNGIGNGDSYKVTATIDTTNVVAETVPEGDTVSNFSVGSVTGRVITVKTPTLKITGLTQNDGTAVVNDADVVLYKGTLEAQASDIKVSYANFDANTAFSTAHWAEVGFYLVNVDGSYAQQQLLTTSQMTSGTLSFDSMDFTVKNGPTNKVIFVVKGKVASTVTAANGLVNKLKLDYFTAKASDNSSPTVTSGSDDLSTSGGTYLTTGYRQVTLADKGKLYLQMRNTDIGFNKDRILLAGTSAWVGKLQLKADDESIKIKDLKLTNTTTSGVDDDLASVCLYRAQVVSATNLISCQTVDSSGVVFFDDINEEVTQGTEYWYIYVNANKMSSLAGGEADSHAVFSFAIATSTADSVAAEGVRSGFTYVISDDATVSAGDIALDFDNDGTYDEAAETDSTAYTKEFVIAGTKISNVQLVSSYGGYSVDTTLNGTDTYTAAILAVTTEATDNTDSAGVALKTKLTGVRFDVSKYASTSINAVTIQKIGGLDAAGALTLETLNSTENTSGTATTSLLSGVLPNDYLLEPGTTSYFVVKATVNSLLATANITNFFRFDLNDLKGSYTNGDTTGGEDDLTNNIDWADGYSTADFSALFLDTDSITGTKIWKTNTQLVY